MSKVLKQSSLIYRILQSFIDTDESKNSETLHDISVLKNWLPYYGDLAQKKNTNFLVSQ